MGRFRCLAIVHWAFFCILALFYQSLLKNAFKTKSNLVETEPGNLLFQKPDYWPRYYGTRRVWLLDGLWNASLLETKSRSQDLRFDSMDPRLDITRILTPDTVRLPSTIEVIENPEHGYLPGFMGFRGVSFFRKRITTQAKMGRLQFQACSFYCRVWWNGIEIGNHRAGGYVAWWLDVPSSVMELAVDGSHELFVLADNRFNATTAPMHTGGDFWHYGGIMRSVEWHEGPPSVTKRHANQKYKESTRNNTIRRVLNDLSPSERDSIDFGNDSNQDGIASLWPWRIFVYPQQDLASVKLILQLAGDSQNIPRDDLVLLRNLRDGHRITICFDVNPSKERLDGDVNCAVPSLPQRLSTRADHSWTKDRLLDLGHFLVPNPKVWSTTHPYLHNVSVSLNSAIVTERFGLRYWGIDERTNRLQLNGNDLKLVGWNHHTQWPRTGASPTDEQLDDDVNLLKRMGHVNFVRGAHYPQDPRWLDRMDEEGIVMWCETLGPGVSISNLQDEYFLRQQDQQINEMMDNAFNHASIAFWGFFNEGPSHKEEACSAYERSSDLIRTRDVHRFITYASNQFRNDKCYDAVNVISSNGYPSWYSAEVPSKFWNNLANDVRANQPPFGKGKPFIISETGAGGIYEWKHNESAVKWTPEYQTRIIMQDVETAMTNANISGIALWHFFDFKVDDKWENDTHCDYLSDVEPPTCGYIDVGNYRPGGANHKGSLDFFRRPKPVFSSVASRYKNVTEKVDYEQVL